MAYASIEIVDEEKVDFGILVDRYNTIRMIGQAMSTADHSFSSVPSLLGSLIREGGWMHWADPHTGRVHRYRPHEFAKFVEADRPDGLGMSVDQAARFFTEGKPGYVEFHQALRGEPGGNNNPTGSNQYAEVNRNNITVDLDEDEPGPATIPVRRESQQGDSVSYAIRRLGRHRPDLLDEVKAGNLSPNRAMVRAGFAPEKITIPLDPATAARRLAMHFRDDRLRELVALLAEYVDQPAPIASRGRPRLKGGVS